MEVIEPIDQMQKVCQKLRQDGRNIRLVPTMGALHAGHSSLISSAKLDHTEGGETPIVIVSIFVNPTQFNKASDFQKYPSKLAEDLKICQSLSIDYVFVPKSEDIYPNTRLENQCKITPPSELDRELEGKSRPGHFEGVLTIVCKLFNLIQPHKAYFGEKDYQQLVLVTRMVQDLNMSVIIRPVVTVRDYDNLPLSSRNVRLNSHERRVAPLIYKLLRQAKEAIESKSSELSKEHNDIASDHSKNLADQLDAIILASMMSTLCLNLAKEDNSQIFRVDYLEIRCAKDLSHIKYDDDLRASNCSRKCANPGSRQLKARLLCSAIVGEVRLLDNIEITLKSR